MSFLEYMAMKRKFRCKLQKDPKNIKRLNSIRNDLEELQKTR